MAAMAWSQLSLGWFTRKSRGHELFFKLQNRGGSCRVAPKLHQKFPSNWGHQAPNRCWGILLFREASSILVTYGTRILQRTQWDPQFESSPALSCWKDDQIIWCTPDFWCLPSLFGDHPDKMLVLSWIPSGNLTSLWKDPPCYSWENPTISMAMFNSFLLVYQRVPQVWSFMLGLLGFTNTQSLRSIFTWPFQVPWRLCGEVQRHWGLFGASTWINSEAFHQFFFGDFTKTIWL